MSDILIRPALPSDAAGMREITRDVWSGTDYVPFVWDRWLADSAGTLIVAIEGDRLVGLQHVAIQAGGIAWIEGIRVASDAQGRGIGRALLEAGLAWAKGAGCRMARLSTSSTNASSRRIAQVSGFRLVGTYASLDGNSASGESENGARLARADDWSEVLRFIEQARGAEADVPLYTEGWTAYELTPARLRLLSAMFSIVVVGSNPIQTIAVATMSPRRPSLRLGYLLGSEDGVASIGVWLRSRVSSAGLESVRAVIPENTASTRSLVAAGFSSLGEWTMLLHELPLSMAAN